MVILYTIVFVWFSWNNEQRELNWSELFAVGEFKSVFKESGSSTLGQFVCFKCIVLVIIV